MGHARALAHLNLADFALIEDRREDARDHALAALKECSAQLPVARRARLRSWRAPSPGSGIPESALAAGREALRLLDAQAVQP